MSAIAVRAQRIQKRLTEDIWNEDVDSLKRCARLRIQFLRFWTKTLQSFFSYSSGLHAAGLTYWTLLAAVPVLCLLLLLARTCGLGDLAHRQVADSIDAVITSIEKGQDEPPQYLAFLSRGQTPEAQAAKRESARELAVKAREISDQLFEKIGRFNVRTLGAVGTLLLFWTVISTFSQVEVAFNGIWAVPKPRSVFRRVGLYAFMALGLPFLFLLVFSMPILRGVKDVLDATLGSMSYAKWAGDALVGLLTSPLFGYAVTLTLASLAAAFFLWVIPNRKLPFSSAWKGGLVTAVLSGVWFRICAVAQVGVAKSSALYGSFAFLPILLAWVYMSWMIVLLGGSMTYAFECVRRRMRDLPVD
ncbi:MAG: YihY/virulence factor BrkB family protein [Kiritimatiellia bacterium]